MRLELPVTTHDGKPIHKNYRHVVVMFASRDKKVTFFKSSFIEYTDYILVCIGAKPYWINKKQIFWRNVKKHFFKKHSSWVPYVFVMDSEAYESLLP